MNIFLLGTSRNVRKAIAGPTTITGGNIQTTGVSKSPLLILREKNINRPIPETNKKTRRTRRYGEAIFIVLVLSKQTSILHDNDVAFV